MLMRRLLQLSTSVAGAVLMAAICVLMLRREAASAGFDRASASLASSLNTSNTPNKITTGALYVVNQTNDATDADLDDGICDSDLVMAGTQCGLRAAIQQANTHSGLGLARDTILLSEGTTYILSLTPAAEDEAVGGDLDIKSDVAILVSGSLSATIDAQQIDRAVHVLQGRLEMSGVVVLNGSVINQGGGILNEGTLILTNSMIASNKASSGGGLYNYGGQIVLNHSMILSNQVSAGGSGIYNARNGFVDAADSEIAFNQTNADKGYGGGIANIGSVNLLGTSVHDNVISSTQSPIGAGIANYSNGRLTLTLSTLAGNLFQGAAISESAGGGLYNEQDSAATLISSTVRENRAANGAGIANYGAMTVSASSVYSNVAVRTGGGIANFERSDTPAHMSLVNTTISDNRSDDDAGGLHNDGVASLSNVTIAGNVADADQSGVGDSGGLDIGPRAESHLSLVVNNSVIALNMDASPAGQQRIADCRGTIKADEPIFVMDTLGCTITGTNPIVLSATNPLLGDLQPNDGSTWSRKPKFGSVLINSGDRDGCADPTGQILLIDQRGTLRPQDGRCDLGAVEALDTTVARVYLPMMAKR